jgi:hypothetical protein
MRSKNLKKHILLLCVLVIIASLFWWSRMQSLSKIPDNTITYPDCIERIKTSIENPIHPPFTCNANIGNGEEDVQMRFSLKNDNSFFEVLRNDIVIFLYSNQKSIG